MASKRVAITELSPALMGTSPMIQFVKADAASCEGPGSKSNNAETSVPRMPDHPDTQSSTAQTISCTEPFFVVRGTHTAASEWLNCALMSYS